MKIGHRLQERVECQAHTPQARERAERAVVSLSFSFHLFLLSGINVQLAK